MPVGQQQVEGSVLDGLGWGSKPSAVGPTTHFNAIRKCARWLNRVVRVKHLAVRFIVPSCTRMLRRGDDIVVQLGGSSAMDTECQRRMCFE